MYIVNVDVFLCCVSSRNRCNISPFQVAMDPLTEDDIEGASLSGRQPKQLTVAELTFWLKCRSSINPSKLKTKAELVSKLVCFQEMWEDNGLYTNACIM